MFRGAGLKQASSSEDAVPSPYSSTLATSGFIPRKSAQISLVVKVHFPLQRSTLLHPTTPHKKGLYTSVTEASSGLLRKRLLKLYKNDPQ